MTEAERTAAQLHHAGEEPTDRHGYDVHVAYDLLSASGDVPTLDDVLDQLDDFLAEYPDEPAPLFEVVGTLIYDSVTDDFHRPEDVDAARALKRQCDKIDEPDYRGFRP